MNLSTRNTLQVKQNNVAMVRQALLLDGGTKLDMARRTGLSVATCTTILNELVSRTEAVPLPDRESTGGRPAVRYVYNPDFAHLLSLYVDNGAGANRLEYAMTTSTGTLIAHRATAPREIDAKAIEQTVSELAAGNARLRAVGVGIPGIVHRGKIGQSDLSSLQDVALAERISKRFGLEAVVENDVNMIAYGYYHQHHGEMDSVAVVMVPRGNGPGTGMVIDGRILSGHTGFAGEVHYLPHNYNPLFQSSRDKGAFVTALARLLATIVALVNPQRIVLTGELVSESMMPELTARCGEAIPAAHQPELVFRPDCSGEYLAGLRLRAQEHLYEQGRRHG